MSLSKSARKKQKDNIQRFIALDDAFVACLELVALESRRDADDDEGDGLSSDAPLRSHVSATEEHTNSRHDDLLRREEALLTLRACVEKYDQLAHKCVGETKRMLERALQLRELIVDGILRGITDVDVRTAILVVHLLREDFSVGRPRPR